VKPGQQLTDDLTEQGHTMQYFERERFELHSEHAAPYDVLLGLLAEEVLQQQGISGHSAGRAGQSWDRRNRWARRHPGYR
jgi:hypothetical protein